MSSLRRVLSLISALIALIPAAVVANAAAAFAVDPATASSGYAAVIRRTAHGVPHVLAANLGSAAFGQAWAYAEDRFCDLADQVVKVRSERSRWFGPGPDGANLASDFAYQSLGVVARAQEQLTRLTAEERDVLNGYVRGFNAFLAATGAARVPGWCAGQPWIGPITAVDVLAYQRDIALLASGNGLVGPIALAEPPGSAAAALDIAPSVTVDGLRTITGEQPLSSNGWAIGADRSQTGKGMLVGNPHFPWEGELKFWESQVTVPGVVNVYGASLGGIPGVQIGFTDKVAWTHTVADGARFTFYSVDLVPGAPTRYYVDGVAEAMTGKTVTVKVKQPDGSLQNVTRTMWSTRYGPVLDLSPIDPSLGWSDTTAFTYRDANIDNDRLLRVWLNMAKATDVNGLKASIGRDQGIPWVNTVATDSSGNAWYTDSSPTPNLSASALAEWASNPLHLLNGSDSRNAWVAVAGARSPGLIPFAQQPQLLRRDYVFNSNDSHWVPNAGKFLTGFSPLQGAEGAPLTARSRQNLKLIGSVARFDLATLGTTILTGDSLTASELTGYTVNACRAQGTRPVVVDGVSVDVSAGCTALANWDRKFDPASRGAVLWRETIGAVLGQYPDGLTAAGPLFGVAFNPADPGRTPRGTPASPTPLLQGLARAVLRVRAAGFALNVPLSTVQYTVKGGQKIPVPGSTELVGIATMAQYSPAPGASLEPFMDPGTFAEGSELTDKGYVVNYGTSFLLTLAYTASGPSAKCILTYSQSTNPASPFFADQTRMFTNKQLRDCRYSEASIGADPALTVKAVWG
ncbi:penicillin acylase family protein [Dactylosporangium sp. NPDC005572]|uniref:penicillin acylase family protein n=1 Tax=Dactylosporangium sp. NPDC005572 TaxID=3156889 RepID=UPI0033A0EFBB